ncbi:c-type cytochrome biogenesis protein CcsB [Candidatus Acidulodesulfobacterium sp. H_13]|uniref:c-type cytochrome biogenesis protein CcsB n=1 Tax=Candidatus Acidulodesulfobacterium sp. H_13 TaxID=3395470 RepID=UPI003AF49D9E
MISANMSILDGSLYFAISLLFLILSFLGYSIFLFTGNKTISKISFLVLILTFSIQTFAFIVRWIYAYKIGIDTPPLVDLYDSLVFFAYVIIFGFILLRIFYDFDALGFIITAAAAAVLSFASFSPLATSAIEPTIPALQSYWLLYHIISLFVSYGAFAAAFGLGILYLIKNRKETDKAKKQGRFFSLLPPSAVIEETIYRVVVFGLFFLTVGVVIGAAWADSAWGGFWSWDPKETWSLITWLTYVLFIHAKITKGWGGKKMAWIAIIGFAIVIFCYLGVDLIIPGLHSYATPGSTSVL